MDPDQREAIIKAVNEDAGKFLSELDPNDPLGLRLREELRLMNEHLLKLMQMGQRGEEGAESGTKFDEKLNLLLPNLEEYWRVLNQRVAAPIPRDLETWEKLIIEHKVYSILNFLSNDMIRSVLIVVFSSFILDFRRCLTSIRRRNNYGPGIIQTNSKSIVNATSQIGTIVNFMGKLVAAV